MDFQWLDDLSPKHIVTSPRGGVRQKNGTRYDLIPFEALEEIAKVFHYGAEKYTPNNWKNLDFDSEQSPIEHGIRHFYKSTTLLKGSDERIRQLAKAAANAIFQIWHEVQVRKEKAVGPVV